MEVMNEHYAVKDKKSAADKVMTTKELAEKLGTKPNVITENAKKCIPNKKIENGKTTYWNEQEATVILECIKNNKVGAGVNLSNDLIGVSTELTPALKIKKTMTVKEVAGIIGYDEEYLRKKCAELGFTRNGVKTLLNERQVTQLKNILIPRTSDMKIRGQENKTELEILQNASRAFIDLQRLYKQKEAEYKAIIEEQKPKALVYDKICNADGLKSVEQVASNLGYGKNNFFALMRGMGIFFYSSKDADGRKVNLPKREYVERGYFVTKEEPYTRGDKDYLYTKIYVTGKGEAWLAELDNIDKKEQLEILSKEVC